MKKLSLQIFNCKTSLPHQEIFAQFSSPNESGVGWGGREYRFVYYGAVGGHSVSRSSKVRVWRW
jgi:hypothetical protein